MVIVRGLLRIVIHQTRAAPIHREATCIQIFDERCLAQSIQVADRCALIMNLSESGQQCCGGRRSRLVQQQLRWIGLGAVPISVELVGDLTDRGAYGDDVQIFKFVLRARLEVFIADIAPTDHGHLVVDREGLVVHAMVNPPEIKEVVQPARTAMAQRVKQAHFDIFMRCECGERGIETLGAVIIQQEANAHATISRLPNRLKQQDAGRIVVPDVILRIDRALCCTGQQKPCGECVATGPQSVNATLTGMVGNTRCDRLTQPRIDRVGERIAGRAPSQWRERATDQQRQANKRQASSRRADHGPSNR